ncbi:cytidine deaminase-like fold-containing protein [Commensalibacter nepenthis]|uniref:Putative cytidine deaminase C-terminal domain-containing protein n=1 Tax=Commensalibacter nepenthis TaxID=3043872 RepID=A0ABT6Q4D9_9PROT|nr:hypothetical protein [Commensalibacter sp. TBRC 10068]MDI2111773.1 hypothetical protein [Commensalibacter sp. TBRC 10068]
MVSAQTRLLAMEAGKQLSDDPNTQLLIANALSNAIAGGTGGLTDLAMGGNGMNGTSLGAIMQAYNQANDPDGGKVDKTTSKVVNNLYDWAMRSLEAASYFPVIGDPASLLLALGYATKGDYKNASLNLAAAAMGIFTVGEGKLIVKGGVEAAEEAQKLLTSKENDTYYSVAKETETKDGTNVDVTVKPTVTAELEVNGQKFTDTNQKARPAEQANKDEPTLIADRINSKKEKTGNDKLPNGNMADAHAEIGAIQQAYKAGLTKDADLTINVVGKDVCGFCRGDIAAAAKESGAKLVTVHAIDEKTNLPKTYIWEPGMKTLKVIEK